MNVQSGAPALWLVKRVTAGNKGLLVNTFLRQELAMVVLRNESVG